MNYEDVDWVRDHAASGWRSRSWIEKVELIAYDAGVWMVCFNGLASSVGQEKTLEAAKRRAFLVYEALVTVLSTEVLPKVEQDDEGGGGESEVLHGSLPCHGDEVEG